MFSIEQIIKDEYPASIKIFINRNASTKIEIIEHLYKYKYIDGNQLNLITERLFGKSCNTYINRTAIKSTKGNHLYIEKNDNTIAYIVPIISEVPMMTFFLEQDREENVEIVYVLPNYYEELKNNIESQLDGLYVILRILEEAINSKTTDLHIDPVLREGKIEVEVLFRRGVRRTKCNLFEITKQLNREIVDCIFNELSTNSKALQELLMTRTAMCEVLDVFKNGKIDLRVEVLETIYGRKSTIRIQKENKNFGNLDNLNFPESVVKIIRVGLKKSSGLSLFTGPRKVGKNVSANACITEISRNKNKYAILAVDHPIEFRGTYSTVDYIDNKELLLAIVKATKKLDFDYLMVNEVPDKSVALAVQDSLNSAMHIITSWHQTRAYTLPYKLQELYGDTYKNLLSQINFVCNQRLFDKLCPHCKSKRLTQFLVDKDDFLYNVAIKNNITQYYVADGCAMCKGRGVILGEVLVIPEIILFNIELIQKLKIADSASEMEEILRKEINDKNLSLEYHMSNAIMRGNLELETILTI